ncbi:MULTISPECIES: hypothetical protein [Paenibacillus]|uniref:Uncharacterized protein n=1 Tax=Paenibacillus pabuli TaxID=1472 RepID=A0A855YEX0_9BACL|nr:MULTISPECIES: hypothetical protein [Paenibacillus]PWW42192.1 hypothetical protein DET56_104249 [Paenibacillus pabuli]PXW07580.1 hypothetical protein DEU73_105248 [Paenibacillus taichungensis]
MNRQTQVRKVLYEKYMEQLIHERMNMLGRLFLEMSAFEILEGTQEMDVIFGDSGEDSPMA